MKNNVILCPACQTEIELTEVVAHQVRQEMAGEIETRRKELEADIAKRDRQLNERAAQIERERRALDGQVQEKLQLERARFAAEARKQAQEDLSLEMAHLREQLDSKSNKLAEAQKAQVEMLKKEQALRDKERELELDLQKRLTAEREKLQQQARAFALEENQLKLADKEKTISELRQQIEALNLKASKTSQQLQGEVLEERFEAMLRQQFAHDLISEIKSGANGADLLQTVRTPAGVECGSILWEVKRTANYSKQWIPKLKEDQREQGAELAVILTQALPDDIAQFSERDGVWVTGFECVLGLAAALRQSLLRTAAARRATEGKREKMEILYAYLSGMEFRHRMEALVDGFLALKQTFTQERAAVERSWKARERALNELLVETAAFYGDLQGIIGAAVLPEVKPLMLARATE